jgi:hypothetical protein
MTYDHPVGGPDVTVKPEFLASLDRARVPFAVLQDAARGQRQPSLVAAHRALDGRQPAGSNQAGGQRQQEQPDLGAVEPESARLASA